MNASNPDPYEVLGIARDATQREVKQAYRSLVKKFHPDHNPENPEAESRFKQIQQAYEAFTGRRKQGRIPPADFYHRNHPPSFFKNEHPFFSFYWAVKNHFDRIQNSCEVSKDAEDLD
jgi:hypothetical protein